MLTQLEVFGIQPSSPPKLTLPIGDILGVNPFQIRGIDGIGPNKADILTATLGGLDGEQYSGSSSGKRNIVITMGLNPDWQTQTIESLRQELYKYFMPKLGGRYRFISTHLPTCEILGYVESLEPNIFSKDPEIQISIICPQPDFIAVDETVVNGIVGPTQTPVDVDYLGNVPTSVFLEISTASANPDSSGLFTAQILKDGVVIQSFAVTATVDTTKSLQINSTVGDKYVQNHIYTETNPVSLLSQMVAGSDWLQLEPPGLSQFNVINVETGQIWTLSYFARFGGL